jgi:hypothetical protein
MTKRDGSDCEYIEIFPHSIGSICTPSKGTALVGRTDAKQGKVPNITRGSRRLTISKKEEQDLRPR